MKRIVVSAFAILLVTAAVQAQTDTTKGAHREHRDMQQRNPYEQLNLSADQQAKLKSMRDYFKKQADALKEQKLTDEERRTGMQTLREQQRTQMEAILTPEQKAQMDKMRENRKDGMRNGNRAKGDSSMRNGGTGFNGHNGNGAAALQKELNLTTEQQAKMKEIRTGFKTKADNVRNDAALTKEQKQAAMRELMTAQQEQIKTVLTKEQQEKLQALRKNRAAQNTK